MGTVAVAKKLMLTAVAGVGGLCLIAGQADANYIQTDLVSDLSSLGALYTDPQLINPWGMSFSAMSPIWISNQGTNSTTLYKVTGSTGTFAVAPVTPTGATSDLVAIPTTMSGPQGPTGQVNNGNALSFPVDNGGNGASAHFIFANLNGTISAWNMGNTAHIQVTTLGASYTGLAINQAQTLLYATNDAGAGSIDVFNGSFAPVSLGANAFVDPNLPAGYVPFNVRDIGGKVYVTYAPAGRAAQTSATAGMGFVDVFDENGSFLQRLITGSQLASPWGIAFAPPTGFGEFSGDLLVGNFSYADSVINAFNPMTGAFLGSIPIDVGAGNTTGGLWALDFGIGGSNGSPDTLYFADGINGETAGLFGAMTVPEPSALALLGAGLAFFGARRFGWRRPVRRSTPS
jgi:uncharacterized protein (TIGR03118 family)